MAFTEFYMQTTGNDQNAGSTTADAASVTSTNGSWDITADTFIATAGTPFSGVAAGEWVSVYNDNVTTGVTYVAQVVTVNGGGVSVTLSTTAKYGTKTTALATGRTAKVGGAWGSLLVVTSLFASVAMPFATRVNIKAGTYANTTVNRIFASAGLGTGPLWWRGYKTVIGDMDGVETVARVDGTDIPLLTWTTGLCTMSGSHQLFSNISVRGARTTSEQVSFGGGPILAYRCRFENTGANAFSSAMRTATARSHFLQCWFRATSTATRTVNVAMDTQFIGCVFLGGVNGLEMTTSKALSLLWCIFRTNGTNSILFSFISLELLIANCTFKAPGGDGINFAVLPNQNALICACVFDSCGGWGINNASGANTDFIARVGNAFYNNTSGKETGFGDMPSLLEQVEAVSPVVSATDLTLVAGALALANGLPGLFENEIYQSFLDSGAVQKQGTASPQIGLRSGGRL